MSSCFSTLEPLYALLSTREKKQSKKFFTANLRNRYIVARALLRSILAKHLGTLPQEIEFVRNRYGKPFVSGVKNIEFNMSHSYDYVCYAITSGMSVGLDIEFYNKEKNIFNIAQSVFTNQELSLFLSLSNFERQDLFFNIWTKKEAIIKALGLGLAYPMEKVNTIENKNKSYVSLSTERYYLHSLNNINSGYKAHLAVKDESDIIINNQIISN